MSFTALFLETERGKQVSLGCLYLLSHKESSTLLTFGQYLAELGAVHKVHEVHKTMSRLPVMWKINMIWKVNYSDGPEVQLTSAVVFDICGSKIKITIPKRFQELFS